LQELLQRKTWDEVSQILAAQFFPLALRKKQIIQISESAEIIKSAFLFFPLQYKIKGHVAPDFSTQTLLCWMRRVTAPQTKQFYFSEYEIDEDTDPKQALDNLKNEMNISDSSAEAVSDLFNMLDEISGTDVMRAELARLVYLPWAFAHIDQSWNEQVEFGAYPSRRKIMREMKKGTVSYARVGRHIFMFGDHYAAKRQDTQNGWVDVRDSKPILFNDFHAQWKAEGQKQGFNIRINFQHVKTLEAQAKVILKSKSNPTRKAMLLNDQARKIRTRYSYTSGTSSQLFDLDKKLSKLFRKHLQANNPNLKYAGCRPNYERKLLIPKPNPFANVDSVSVDFWKAMFSPWRLK